MICSLFIGVTTVDFYSSVRLIVVTMHYMNHSQSSFHRQVHDAYLKTQHKRLCLN